MDNSCSLSDLPDLAVYTICSFITCPFDLLHFGNTCSRFRRISQAHSLWWSLALHWLSGLWIHMEEGSVEENSRNWLLHIIRFYSSKSTRTKHECHFLTTGETWLRVDTFKFRFLVNLLRLAYTKEKDDHPAVLYEEWLYDIGMFRRLNNGTTELELSKESILQLSCLSQASERDLCRRKQPYKDPKYYIKPVSNASRQAWMTDLFPTGPTGSICPLLMCPFQGIVTSELSGLHGLAMCLSLILERFLRSSYKFSFLPLMKVWEFMKVFCTVFASEVMDLKPMLEARLGSMLSLRSTVLTVLEENAYDTTQLQGVLEHFGVSLKCADVLSGLYAFLKQYEGIDQAVDEMRMKLRRVISEEIDHVLFPDRANESAVLRLNLSDSDLIGGDNSRQEMSSAAFISPSGVLVTWHLTGRMRY